MRLPQNGRKSLRKSKNGVILDENRQKTVAIVTETVAISPDSSQSSAKLASFASILKKLNEGQPREELIFRKKKLRKLQRENLQLQKRGLIDQNEIIGKGQTLLNPISLRANGDKRLYRQPKHESSLCESKAQNSQRNKKEIFPDEDSGPG